MNKKYSKKKIIDKIKCEGVTHIGQVGVTDAVTGFYKKLYSSGVTVQGDDEFYQHCPTLSDESKVIMEADITEDELRAALNTCLDAQAPPINF